MDDERRAQARYPRHKASVKTARTLARQLATEWELDGLKDDLELIISELVTNAVIHAKTARGREIALTFDLNPRRLRVEVKDSGDGCPRCSPNGEESESESGRGLAVVEALAEKWGVSERVIGKIVWAEMSLTGKQVAE
ncbi:ATP-binding protein [Streptomyces sp. NPDC000941]